VREIQIDEGGVASGAGSSSQTRFVLNNTQEVRVTLYDLLGRRVRVLLDEEVPEGFRQNVRIPTRSLSSGPYFLRFVGEQFATTRKIVVVN
jgi:lysyl endopeptidase